MFVPKVAPAVVVVTFVFALKDGFEGTNTVPVMDFTMVAFCAPSTVVVTVAVPFNAPAVAVFTVRLTVVAAGASAAVTACEPVSPVDPTTVAASGSTPSGCTTLAAFETERATVTPAALRMTVPKLAGAVTCMIGGTW